MSGLMGKASLAANADTDLYTVPAGKVATANVSLCNRGAAEAKVRIAVRNGALSNSDYLEYDVTLPANGVLERTQIAMSAGEIITVRSTVASVSARAHGFEETA